MPRIRSTVEEASVRIAFGKLEAMSAARVLLGGRAPVAFGVLGVLGGCGAPILPPVHYAPGFGPTNTAVYEAVTPRDVNGTLSITAEADEPFTLRVLNAADLTRCLCRPCAADSKQDGPRHAAKLQCTINQMDSISVRLTQPSGHCFTPTILIEEGGTQVLSRKAPEPQCPVSPTAEVLGALELEDDGR